MLDIIKTIDVSKEVIKEICLVGFANDEEKVEKFYNSYIKKKEDYCIRGLFLIGNRIIRNRAEYWEMINDDTDINNFTDCRFLVYNGIDKDDYEDLGENWSKIGWIELINVDKVKWVRSKGSPWINVSE